MIELRDIRLRIGMLLAAILLVAACDGTVDQDVPADTPGVTTVPPLGTTTTLPGTTTTTGG